jgi:CRP/FNR family transcriptional regulator
MGEISNFTACTISLNQIRCFEKLTEEESRKLEESSVVIKYKKGEIVCKQGGLVSHIMFLEDGLAKVFMDSGGNSLVLKIICSGNLIGLSSISVENNTYHYSVRTYIDSEVRQIDLKVFRELLTSNAEFAREVIDIFAANSVQIYGRFFCLTNKQAYGRLADMILCLADRVFKVNGFDLPLTRKDLAELSGLSSETVIRILKRFSNENLIKVTNRHFEILDYNALKRISETG